MQMLEMSESNPYKVNTFACDKQGEVQWGSHWGGGGGGCCSVKNLKIGLDLHSNDINALTPPPPPPPHPHTLIMKITILSIQGGPERTEQSIQSIFRTLL